MLDLPGFAALIKRKRGEKGLSQENLATDVFDDPARKSDISRIERAKVTPQERTIQRLQAALDISDAELDPLRSARPSAAQLDQIPTLSRDALELLATRFEVEKPFDRSDADLRQILTQKAEEYRAYKSQIDGLDDRVAAIANLKGAAQDAARNLNFDEVEDLLLRVDEVETEIAAETKVARAKNALLRNRAEDAFRILSAAADSFSAIDPIEPVRRRNAFFQLLYFHGLRYGGTGLALSAKMLQSALDSLTKEDAPEIWGALQNNLAIALQEQGKRTAGPEGTQLLADAVTAYQMALTIYTKADYPEKWAMTQNNFGNALRNQGTRTAGPEGTQLLADAVTAFKKALTIRVKAEQPVQWAMTQNNLANALSEQGTRTAGPEGTQILADAVTAFKKALTIHTKAEQPVQWAMTQNNLANALQEQGTCTAGPEGAQLLSDAVTAYQNALTIRTKADHPVGWAMTRNNLAAALKEQGTRTPGPEGAQLLADAVTAYQNALAIYTKADHPVAWATTQENLAILECARADHDSTADPIPHLRAALSHVDAALTVYDPEHMPDHREQATTIRDHLRSRLGL